MKVKLLFFETQVTPFWTKQKLEYTNISYLIFLYQLLIIKSISTDVLSFKSQFLDVYIIFCFSSFSGFIMVSASLFYQTMAVSIFRLLQDRSELKKKRKVFRYSVQFLFSICCSGFVSLSQGWHHRLFFKNLINEKKDTFIFLTKNGISSSSVKLRKATLARILLLRSIFLTGARRLSLSIMI